jgi:hypothetical protein
MEREFYLDARGYASGRDSTDFSRDETALRNDKCESAFRLCLWETMLRWTSMAGPLLNAFK